MPNKTVVIECTTSFKKLKRFVVKNKTNVQMISFGDNGHGQPNIRLCNRRGNVLFDIYYDRFAIIIRINSGDQAAKSAAIMAAMLANKFNARNKDSIIGWAQHHFTCADAITITNALD